MALTVKEIQSTPNPNALKFVLDRRITENPVSFYSPDQARGQALAAKLMAIAGVSNIMLLGDFVTIGKTPEARWADIKGRVKKVLSDS